MVVKRAASVARRARGAISFTPMSSPRARPLVTPRRPPLVSTGARAHRSSPASFRAARVGATLLVVGAAAACGGKDPYAPVAQSNTVGTTFVLYPMRRVTPPQNSALDLRTPLPVRPSIVVSSLSGQAVLVPNFDVAFDVDAAGHVVLLAPKLVTSAQSIPRTGFQISSTRYDSLTAAPGGTYQADSAFRATVGQTIVVQAQGTCPVSSPFYAKLVIDSVNSTTSALYVRARIDPNCGFKSFAAGLPGS